MPKYEVTTFDVCASGFERLRSYEEFILLALIDAETSAEDLLEQWVSDIQSCERGDDFDFDAARKAVEAYHAENIAPLFAKRDNPFDLDARDVEDEESFDQESATAYLYVRVEGAHFPVY